MPSSSTLVIPGIQRSTAARAPRTCQAVSGATSTWIGWVKLGIGRSLPELGWRPIAYAQATAFTSIYLYSGRARGRIEAMSAEDVLKALAEPRRQQILRLVRTAPRSVGEIAEGVDVTQQAVSQHLQVLKDAGLVAVRQDGTRRLYVIRPEGLESLDQFLAELWPAGLRRLKTAVEDDAQCPLGRPTAPRCTSPPIPSGSSTTSPSRPRSSAGWATTPSWTRTRADSSPSTSTGCRSVDATLPSTGPTGWCSAGATPAPTGFHREPPRWRSPSHPTTAGPPSPSCMLVCRRPTPSSTAWAGPSSSTDSSSPPAAATPAPTPGRQYRQPRPPARPGRPRRWVA